jgi:hypothetical protein
VGWQRSLTAGASLPVQVSKNTTSQGHKVKIMGVIVSEQAGATHSIQNSLALEKYTMNPGSTTFSWATL